MNQKNENPNSGETVGPSHMSKAGCTDAVNHTTAVDVICIAETERAVLLQSAKTHEQLWFPKKRIEIISGEIAQGMECCVRVDRSLIANARQHKRSSGNVDFSLKSPVLVTGDCIDNRHKSIGVLCDADRVKRWFPKTKIIELKTDAVPNQQVSVVVPAWVLKCTDDSFPSWVKGAIYS